MRRSKLSTRVFIRGSDCHKGVLTSTLSTHSRRVSLPAMKFFFCHGQTNKISSKTNRLDIKIRCTSNKQQSPKRSSSIPYMVYASTIHMTMPNSPPIIKYQKNKMYRINYFLRSKMQVILIFLDSQCLILKVIRCSSLRGGGGELDTLKTLTYGSNYFCTKHKLDHTNQMCNYGLSSVKSSSQKNFATYSQSQHITALKK